MRHRVDLSKPLGIAPDQPPVFLPDGIGSDSRNVRYRDGAIEKVGGYTPALFSLSATAIWAAPITDGTTRFWVYGSPTVLYATDTVTSLHAVVTGSVSISASNNGFTGGAFHGYMVVTDGNNIPQSWVPSLASDFASLTAWPTTLTTQLIRFWGDFIWAARNTTSGVFNPREIRWSDKAAIGQLPGSWDYTDPTNQAGITDLGQTPDEIVDMRRLRDSMIVYKQNSTWTAEYIGTADVFSFRQLFAQSGLLARNCIVSFGDSHFAVTDSDIIIHDGNSPRSIADGRVRKWFFNRLSSQYYARTFVTLDYQNRDILICFPESAGDITYPNLALCWNWASDAWDVRELGRQMTYGEVGTFALGAAVSFQDDTGTFDGGSGVFDEDNAGRAQQKSILLSAGTPAAFQLGSGETFNGTTMTCYFERRGITVSATDLLSLKRIKRLYPLALGTIGDTLRLYVGTRASVESAVLWNGPYTFTIGTDHKIDVRLSARFLDLKVEYAGTNPLRVFGMDIDFDSDGHR